MRPRKDATVYLCTDKVDFRKSIAGLSVIVEQAMVKNLFDNALFIFTNKTRDRIKILYWEKNGFCLWYKVLEKDKFKWPKASSERTVSLNGEELNWLLDGFDIWNNIPHQSLQYSIVS